MLKEIRNERAKFLKREGVEPNSIALNYYSGLDLLTEVGRLSRRESIKELLLEDDRQAITRFLRSVTIYNMTIIIVDIIGTRGIVCQTQQ